MKILTFKKFITLNFLLITFFIFVNLYAAPIENFDSYNTYADFISAGYDDTPGGGSYDIKAITNGYSGKCLFYQYNIPNAWGNVRFTYWGGTTYWSNYKSITIFVKGSNVEKLSIYFKESDDNDEWVYNYTGSITMNWQKIIIPLKQSAWTYVDWDGDGGANNMTHNAIDHWMIYLESSTGGVINAKIWIDEINGSTNEIKDDWSFNSYNDYFEFLAAGYSEQISDWNPTDGDTKINLREITTNGAYSGKCLYYNYDIGDAWESVGFKNSNLTNLSSYKSISFFVKASNNAPNVIFYLSESDGDEWVYTYNGVSGVWSKVIVPLKDTTLTHVNWGGPSGNGILELNQVNAWAILFESSTGGIVNGKAWIDEIKGNTNEIKDDWSFNSYNDYFEFLAAGYSANASDWRAPFGNTKINLAEITTNGAYSGKCLHFNYNIGDAWESIGFVNNNPTNWQGGLSFDIWIKGYAGDPETVDIYFKEADGDEWVAQKSGLNANWQKISIPLVAGSWTYVDWDGDGGPHTFSVANIVKWLVALESSTGNRLNRDVWFDEMQIYKINTPPTIVDFSPKYNSSTNNPVIEIKVVDEDGINTSSIVLKVNSTTVTPSVITGSTNIISYNATGLPNESRVKVELSVADNTSKTQNFSFSFWVGSQEFSYDTFEYDELHFNKFWGTPFYLATGSATTVTKSPQEGSRCVRVSYSLNPSYGEFGISKTFDTVQNWAGFSNLYIWTKASNVQANTFLDVLIYENDGDVWTYQIATAFDQTTWERQTVFIGNDFERLTFATWCTGQEGYAGDKLPDPDQVKKVVFNVSGQGKTNTVFFDNFYIHGWSPPVDIQAPTFANLNPYNNQTNVKITNSIYFEIDDNVKVASNSINVEVKYINYVSNDVYVTKNYTPIVNGAIRPGWTGSILSDGGVGYNVRFKPASGKLPSGTTILVKISAKDTSNNLATNSYSFITAGVAFGITYPANNAKNVATNANITIYMDRVNDNTINMIILSSTNWSVTNWASKDGNPQPPYDDGGIGAFGLFYPVRWAIDCPPFAYGSTNKVITWAADFSGNWTTNIFTFVVISDKPQIQNTKPINGQNNFSINSNLYFETVDNVAVVSNSINVTLNGMYIIQDGAIMSNYSVSFSPNIYGGYNVTINSTGLGLTYNTSYTMKIWCRDNNNNWVTNIIQFTTEPAPDITKPITTVSPKGGLYFGKVKVTLTANEPAYIYYTIDGSVPTTNSAKFFNSGSIEISADTILKYFARDLAGNSEEIKTEEYKIIITSSKAISAPTVANLSKGERCKIMLGEDGYAQIKIYNVRGDLVKEFNRKYYSQGEFEIFPDDTEISAGLYIVYVKGDKFEQKLKIIIVK
jgi:hypothetical protein